MQSAGLSGHERDMVICHSKRASSQLSASEFATTMCSSCGLAIPCSFHVRSVPASGLVALALPNQAAPAAHVHHRRRGDTNQVTGPESLRKLRRGAVSRRSLDLETTASRTPRNSPSEPAMARPRWPAETLAHPSVTMPADETSTDCGRSSPVSYSVTRTVKLCTLQLWRAENVGVPSQARNARVQTHARGATGCTRILCGTPHILYFQ